MKVIQLYSIFFLQTNLKTERRNHNYRSSSSCRFVTGLLKNELRFCLSFCEVRRSSTLIISHKSTAAGETCIFTSLPHKVELIGCICFSGTFHKNLAAHPATGGLSFTVRSCRLTCRTRAVGRKMHALVFFVYVHLLNIASTCDGLQAPVPLAFHCGVAVINVR